MRIGLLDHGYIQLVESWGSDERIIEAARMSTGKGFQGWGGDHGFVPDTHGLDYCHRVTNWNLNSSTGDEILCGRRLDQHGPTGPGDEKLLAYLWNNKHATPFEMAGLIVEVQAPIFVFREWHRHRTQCLSPDTLIHFDAPKSRARGHSVYKQRIEDLWRKWQPTQRALRPERQTNALYGRSRIQGMSLRCLVGDSEEIGHTRIVDIIKGEPKPMVRVTVASGRTIVATLEHRFFTSLGWRTLREAVSNNLLLAMEGTTRNTAMRWEVPAISDAEEGWAPIVGWPYEVSNQGRVRRVDCVPKRTTVGAHGYDVVSLNQPGAQRTVTVHGLVLEAWRGIRPDGCEARHLNSNRADNRLVNLAWGTPKENADDRVDADRQQRLVATFEEIVAVENAGTHATYDLTVEGPWHNFLADGFVVHNSYNELSARYTPLPDLDFSPSWENLHERGAAAATNRQAAAVATYDESRCRAWHDRLSEVSRYLEAFYQEGLAAGVPKELARIRVPVGRYSRMRASANLRNWLAFLTLRMAPNAQYEIRQYANAVGTLIERAFPRTWELFARKDVNV